jgi:hypothetical protein
MTILEQAVNKMQQLPIAQQQQALSFIEFLAFKLGDRPVKQEVGEVLIGSDKPVSCYDLTKKWIGIADDLPDDLSVNPKYMEGYGE